jgi:hypothetical protein
MNVLACLSWNAACGAGAGLVSCIQVDAVHFPRFGKGVKGWILRPGVFGNMIVGACAASVVWSLNGPCAFFDFASDAPQKVSLTLGQLASSFLVGLSGGKLLMVMAAQKSDAMSKSRLSELSKKAIENQD